MRRKTEERRLAILAAADKVFHELGFERASMAQICAEVGFSKATLYSYYKSKEDLFFEVMVNASEQEFMLTLDALSEQKGSAREVLFDFGKRFVNFLYSPRVIAVKRLIYSQTERSDMVHACYERGPCHGQQAIMNCLQRFVQLGELKDADLQLMSLQFKALLEARWIELFAFQKLENIPTDELDRSVNEALDVFLAAYGKH